ncbi:MAG: hypothetical protein ONB23_03765 [candidate division KSB1 bacterium]|nr:hypothetical protein [candidate division KSB1 bacterium]
MDLVFLSVLIGVAMAVAVRILWDYPLAIRFGGTLAAAQGVGLLVSAVSTVSPFYFASRYWMTAAFALVGTVVAVGYAPSVFTPRRPGPYSTRLVLGLLTGAVVYAGYWFYLQRTGLAEELPVAPRQILFAFLALGLLIVLGFSATAGILRSYWPPPKAKEEG